MEISCIPQDGTFTVSSGTDNIEYVIVAGGGGGGGGDVGAGGGAGGYRANVPGFPLVVVLLLKQRCQSPQDLTQLM